MKSIVVDTSSLISISTNCLLWVLDALKNKINFYVTKGVVEESINHALKIERFRLSGVRLLKRLCEGTLDYIEYDVPLANSLTSLANSIFFAWGKPLRIVHPGEMGAISAALKNKINYFLIDERITGMLIDNPEALCTTLSNRFHTKVEINNEALSKFRDACSKIQVIRSSDLMCVAYEAGLMENYIKACGGAKVRKDLLSGLLWGLKFSGCAISGNDIKQYLKVLF